MTKQGKAVMQVCTLAVELEGIAGHVEDQLKQLIRLGKAVPPTEPSQAVAFVSAVRALRDAGAALAEASDMLQVVASGWVEAPTPEDSEPPAEE